MTDARMPSIIAIDGPAASGKSAVGAALALRLGYRFLDTGAMYRALTWLALRGGVDVRDPDEVVRALSDADLAVSSAPGGETRVMVAGVDATPHLREDAVDENVSLVSRIPAVRRTMVEIQRDVAAEGRIVMIGRDIGTVVLPDAGLKVYLDASAEVRARRRAEQHRQSGSGRHDTEELRRDMERRDQIDSSRETSPLTAAADAVIINTDTLTIEEVIERILKAAA